MAKSGTVNFYNGVATQSLRWDFANTSYLNKTFGSAGSRQKFTYSCWIKIALIENADGYALLSVYNDTQDDTGYFHVHITNGNLHIGGYNTNWRTGGIEFRDPSAWYNIIIAVDTTQGTANNRVRVYVNNQEITTLYSGISNMSQNANTPVGDACSHFIGRQQSVAGSQRSDGYMAECNMINNQQLTPSSFGEVKNGVWIPIDTSGLTFGTNGFRLQFDQVGVGTASTSTIGADTSGNTNHFTSTNIVASDCAMPDSPENNFATLNPLDTVNSPTFSNGNLQFARSSNYAVATGSMAMSTGKWYWEVYCKTVTTSGENSSFGISRVPAQIIGNNYLGYNSDGDDWALLLDDSGADIYYSNSQSVTDSNVNGADGDIFNFALDADTGELWFGRNNTWFASGDPAGGTGEIFTASVGTDGVYYVIVSLLGNDLIFFNFGQDSSFAGNETAGGNTDGNGQGDFAYAPPSGFLSLCTSNLPEPTIGPNSDTQADNYFGTLTWSGDDVATRKIATGESAVTGTVDFTPDWSWIKRRNGASNGSDHLLLDIVRGVDAFNGLSANATQAEGLTAAGSTWVNFGDINNFETGGFTVQKGTDGSHTLEGINQSGGTYVGWNWKAGGSASSNTDGSITSTVSANTDAGFSIVTFPADNTAGRTVGHGLGVAPKMIITKGRAQTTAWYTYNYNIGAGNYLVLNTTAATASSSGLWGNTHPTSTVFTIGNNDAGYNSGGANDALAYCFAEIEGYSKFGSYTGNNATDGNMIFTNFSPALVIIKYVSGSAGGTKNWHMYDNKRSAFNPTENVLFANASTAESGASAFDIDFLSNGFKLRNAEGAVNNGAVYIYMCWAETPFKYATAK